MIKIVKAKDRKPSKAEMVFNWLLDTGGKAKGVNGGGQRIEITLKLDGLYNLRVRSQSNSIHIHGFGTEAECVKQLDYFQAEIPKEPKPSLTASFRRMVSDTKADIQKRHTSDLQAFIGIS